MARILRDAFELEQNPIELVREEHDKTEEQQHRDRHEGDRVDDKPGNLFDGVNRLSKDCKAHLERPSPHKPHASVSCDHIVPTPDADAFRGILAARGGHRKESDTYLFMPITVGESSVRPTPEPKKEKPVAKNEQPKPQLNDISSILDEIGSIKDGLKDLSRRAGAVQAAVRSYGTDLRRREKAVQQTLAGLKQLQKLSA